MTRMSGERHGDTGLRGLPRLEGGPGPDRTAEPTADQPVSDRLNAKARSSVDRVFLEILRARYPGTVWRIDRPGEGPEGRSAAASRDQASGALDELRKRR